MKPPIDPVVWTPPPRRRLPNPTRLPALTRFELPACGEDVVVEADGSLIAGLVDGRVVRLHPSRPSVVETLVHTGGRPLGLELDREGRLIICDTLRGLLRFDLTERRLQTLVDARMHRLGFCNNAAVARDGSIYFSDSSHRFGVEHWLGDIMEHSGTGRLLKWSPDGKVDVLKDGLQFANGVALGPDEAFVAVAQTGGYCIERIWLAGEKAGQHDTLIEGLPGFPDNMASDDAGLIWVALASPRNPLLDVLHRAAPLLRRIVWALPDAIRPAPDRTLRVLAIDEHGRIARDLMGKSEVFHMVTGVRVHGDKLYMASLEEPALIELSLR